MWFYFISLTNIIIIMKINIITTECAERTTQVKFKNKTPHKETLAKGTSLKCSFTL